MLHSLVLLALAQVGTAPGTQLTVPPVYEQLNRLASTPNVDGKLENEEWEALAPAGAGSSFFQWEPGKLHVASKLAVGQDALISLDLQGNGWHQGADNLEIRAKWNGTGADIQVRRMTDSGTTGPVWLDTTDYRAAMKAAASGDAATWNLEVSVEDPGLSFIPRNPGSKVGIRVDSVTPTELPLEAYMPRAVPPVNLVWERGAGLPLGLTWRTEFKGRSVMPGENLRIRVGFTGSEAVKLQRIEMKTEGLGNSYANSIGMPFPAWDRKFRCFVDYNTKLTKEAPLAWRIMRTTVTPEQGAPAILQTCYEVTGPITLDYDAQSVQGSTEPKDVKVDCHIRSNTGMRVNGVFRVQAPAGWQVTSGDQKPFSLVLARSRKRQVFMVKVPGGFKGTAPIKLIADAGEYHVERTVWLVVN